MAKKKYYGKESRNMKRSQRMIKEDLGEYATLPNRVIMDAYPSQEYYDGREYGDTLSSVDMDMNKRVREYRRGEAKRRF